MHPWDAIWIFVILSSLQPVAQKLLLAQSNLLSWSWIRKRAGVARSARDQELPRLLRGPASVRVRGAACDVHAPAAEFEKEDHVEASEPERLDREKVAGDDRIGVRTQKSRQLSWARSPAGDTPACRRILATVVAQTRTPTPPSSPTIRS